MANQSARNKVSLRERLQKRGPKKLLALDGGGIRGVLSLEILRKLESLLRTTSGNADYRLADYFDYISGTSTGGIIAAGLAIGMSVDKILEFYEQSGAQMFEPAKLRHRLSYHYQSEPLAKMLKCVFGEDTQLGSISRNIAAADLKECYDGFPLADLKQPVCQVQSSRSPRLQPEIPAMAARESQHRRADLLPARGHRSEW